MSRHDRHSGLFTWGGRVTPIEGDSLLPFFGLPTILIHLHGHAHPVTISHLGESSSEIEATGVPPWLQD